MAIPTNRLRAGNRAAVNPAGDFVLYWMIASRRVGYNFALEHAVDLAVELHRPLLIFEPLRVDYPWACDRFHAFVIDGMRDNAAALAKTAADYYPYVEPAPGAGKGLLLALAERAALVVTDDYPDFFLPRMIAAAARLLPVRLDCVDGCGLYPLRATDRVFTTAASFRRHLQRELPRELGEMPRPNPLARRRLAPIKPLPAALRRRWPAAALRELDGDRLRRLPIDHQVVPVATRGGARRATRRLRSFLADQLSGYQDNRNQVDVDAQSHLSPYLHFGHISAHQIFAELMKRAGWSPARLADRPTGSRSGWWGTSANVEAFLDQLITWRELGHNAACHQRHHDRYQSLPVWARTSLAEHQGDPRPFLYSRGQLERAATHDRLWNAAQRQLVREGTIHNYLRMLWGKKILEWSKSPRQALKVMLELNNKYALDGRDPNSTSGIFWILGRYDRAWGPEREIFGKIRYMSSENTARKLRRIEEYIAEFPG